MSDIVRCYQDQGSRGVFLLGLIHLVLIPFRLSDVHRHGELIVTLQGFPACPLLAALKVTLFTGRVTSKDSHASSLDARVKTRDSSQGGFPWLAEVGYPDQCTHPNVTCRGKKQFRSKGQGASNEQAGKKGGGVL